MACYNPIPAVRTPAGMRLHPKPPEKPTHWLPCAKCLGCRETRAATWSIRLEHEARSHSHNTFLTLTYADDKLPSMGKGDENEGLQKRDLQLFWKRLRKHLNDNSLKYYACGEYGDHTQRPHYHAAVFGLPPFHDGKLWKGDNYISETLNDIWGLGMVTQSELTPGRIRYTAGYIMKKAGYRRQVYCNPEGIQLQPPFQLMSKGLGAGWLDKYQNDLRNGFVLDSATKKRGIPRYYLDRIKRRGPSRQGLPIHRSGSCPHETLLNLIDKAKLKTLTSLPENDPARNRAAMELHEHRVKQARLRKAF